MISENKFVEGIVDIQGDSSQTSMRLGMVC